MYCKSKQLATINNKRTQVTLMQVVHSCISLGTFVRPALFGSSSSSLIKCVMLCSPAVGKIGVVVFVRPMSSCDWRDMKQALQRQTEGGRLVEVMTGRALLTTYYKELRTPGFCSCPELSCLTLFYL